MESYFLVAKQITFAPSIRIFGNKTIAETKMVTDEKLNRVLQKNQLKSLFFGLKKLH
jgi:hypothetical protein